MQLARCLFFTLTTLHFAEAARLQGGASPVFKVLDLLGKLKSGLEGDSLLAQQVYDKSACWCEKTLERKAKAIAAAKALLKELQVTITKLTAELAAQGAEIKQLKKDIAENGKAQREATEVRSKEKDEYTTDKVELEQCIGALEAAIKALTGAGAGKGFLQQAQLVSVAADLRRVLQRNAVTQSASDQDLTTIQRFIERPTAFVQQNPFGDYAPQSSQIQGILKTQYDFMAADLEKANAGEAVKEKGFQELMTTKKSELASLGATLEAQEGDSAKKGKERAQSKTRQDDTAEQLEADEAFFEDTEATCKRRALVWSQVSASRTEEMQGINKAIEILSSSKATNTFTKSAQTFFQVRSTTSVSHSVALAKAMQALEKNAALSKISALLQAGGHFDKVIALIDRMVEVLRKEDAEDIAHRDRCQRDQGNNKNEQEDLDAALEKNHAENAHMKEKQTKTTQDVTDLEDAIAETKKEMDDTLEQRNGEEAQFQKALKDDSEAVALINQAIKALSKFYDKGEAASDESFVQIRQEPEYTIDEDEAPDGPDADYIGGRKGESNNVISSLSMIAEDIQKEMKESRTDEAEAQKAYEKENEAMRKTLSTQEKSKAASESVLADLGEKTADSDSRADEIQGEIQDAKDMEASLERDCKWVDEHFKSRAAARKKEMHRMQEAKSALAGAEQGDFDAVEMA